MALAGRCECGVARSLAALDAEAHLVCAGLRRCSACAEVKAIADGFYKNGEGRPDARCKPCRNARSVNVARRRFATDPEFRAYRRRKKSEAYWDDPELWRLKQQVRDQKKAAAKPRRRPQALRFPDRRDLPSDVTRLCRARCGKELPLSAFRIDGRGYVAHRCNACRLERRRERYRRVDERRAA